MLTCMYHKSTNALVNRMYAPMTILTTSVRLRMQSRNIVRTWSWRSFNVMEAANNKPDSLMIYHFLIFHQGKTDSLFKRITRRWPLGLYWMPKHSSRFSVSRAEQGSWQRERSRAIDVWRPIHSRTYRMLFPGCNISKLQQLIPPPR